ncbi:endonuclease/exonuclease/phosphatase family protein [Thiohalorhabdus denitrificans]|uniref:Metal-dependent hydrolase, endonuclease/exonuclease/phosphatase family n=1 Tax=Thiohalorhabdus denitrificans TaxID=381306 RepID=A0A1G5CIX0_9GAMM|nr:endonuclease/exonuclease/phosphatase family protein [Thiohalorhabdus denitrificans]SCY02264.1 Metal-dependent hydrolase, endonuclease/exonuclease/phosphatase family [Thiohalorhabdus denitrificans]
MAEGGRPGDDRVGVRVATYNIHKGVGRDRRRDPGRIAAVIRNLGAGVLALQEVDTRQGHLPWVHEMDYLAETSGYTAVVGPTHTRYDYHFGNVVLSAHPVSAVRHVDLSIYRREPRGALELELQVHGTPLRVVATHLGLYPGERLRQVRWLLEHLGGVPAEPTVLLGDLNEWLPWARSLRLLHRVFGRSPGPPSFPAAFPVLALDRIWAHPREGLEDVRAWNTPHARGASDHLPVTAHFEFSRAGVSADDRYRSPAPAPRDRAVPR